MNIPANINKMIALGLLVTLLCIGLNYSWEQVEMVKKDIKPIEEVKR